MTQLNYYNYLRSIPTLSSMEELSSEDSISDFLYGIFQCFMPDGKDVEKVFLPIMNGNIYAEKLIPIYKLTEESVKKHMVKNQVPGYFALLS